MVFGDKKWSKFHYFTQKIMADIIGRVTDTIGIGRTLDNII